MEIGILGAGNIGASLGRLWAQKGHAIAFGVRDATKTRELVTLTRGRAATLADAAATAAVVVLAVPWSAAADAIAAAGDLAGKIVVDCINPVLPGLRGLAIGRDTSAAEEIARLAPGARVVKAFNTMGAQTLSFAEHLGANGFLCGDDAAAKAVVAGLARDLGLEPIDCGALSAARLLEPLALLWIHLAHRVGLGPNIAFHLVRGNHG